MKFLDMVKVDDLDISLVQRYGKIFGLSEHALKNVDMINDLIGVIRKSGNYTTLGDVLNDQELIDSFIAMFQGDKQEMSQKDILNLDIHSTITCPKCGYISTLKKITRR